MRSQNWRNEIKERNEGRVRLLRGEVVRGKTIKTTFFDPLRMGGGGGGGGRVGTRRRIYGPVKQPRVERLNRRTRVDR